MGLGFKDLVFALPLDVSCPRNYIPIRFPIDYPCLACLGLAWLGWLSLAWLTAARNAARSSARNPAGNCARNCAGNAGGKSDGKPAGILL